MTYTDNTHKRKHNMKPKAGSNITHTYLQTTERSEGVRPSKARQR